MENRASSIVLDTNLWISFLISQDFTKLDELLFTNQCRLIFSQELLEEFLEVAKRPKFRRFFSQQDLEDIIETIHEYADFVPVTTIVTICRGPKDNFLLSLSVDAKADYLITGDKDLLALKAIESTQIVTLSEYLQT